MPPIRAPRTSSGTSSRSCQPTAITRLRSSPGKSWSGAAIRTLPRWRQLQPQQHGQRMVRHARQLRARFNWTTVGGYRRQHALAARDAPTASGPWRPKGRAARDVAAAASKCRAEPRCAGRGPTPDLETFFVAVQHPGEADDDDAAAHLRWKRPRRAGRTSRTACRPRPSVVAITRKGRRQDRRLSFSGPAGQHRSAKLNAANGHRTLTQHVLSRWR